MFKPEVVAKVVTEPRALECGSKRPSSGSPFQRSPFSSRPPIWPMDEHEDEEEAVQRDRMTGLGLASQARAASVARSIVGPATKGICRTNRLAKRLPLAPTTATTSTRPTDAPTTTTTLSSRQVYSCIRWLRRHLGQSGPSWRLALGRVADKADLGGSRRISALCHAVGGG